MSSHITLILSTDLTNSSISEFWWTISSINGLLLLLLLNHWANFFALCGNLIPIHPSRMPEKSFVKRFWGLSKWQEKTPKRQKTSISFSFGALQPMIEGWQTGEPFESEYFLIYGDFFCIFSKFLTYWSNHLIIMLMSQYILKFSQFYILLSYNNAYISIYSQFFSILYLNSHISQLFTDYSFINCLKYCSMQPGVINKILHFVWSTGWVMWSLKPPHPFILAYIHLFLMHFYKTKCVDVFYSLDFMYLPFQIKEKE